MALIVVLVNHSDLAPISDYTYEVLVGDGTPARSKTLKRGTVTGHQRSDGWLELLAKLIATEQGETS